MCRKKVVRKIRRKWGYETSRKSSAETPFSQRWGGNGKGTILGVRESVLLEDLAKAQTSPYTQQTRGVKYGLSGRQ